MSKALVIPKALIEAGKELAEVIGYNPTDDIFSAGRKVIAVRDYMNTPDVMKYIKSLKGSSLGFKTDEGGKQPEYSDLQVANCVTEAFTHGFKVTNNEFNIIRGNFMGVLNGYRRLVRDLPGVDNFTEPVTGEPIQNGNIVTIPVTCKFVFDGKPRVETQSVVLTKGPYDKADMWSGKAKRRFLKDLLANLSGITIPDYDYEDNPEVVTATPVSGVNSKQEDVKIVDAVVVETKKKAPVKKAVVKKPIATLDPIAEANAAAQMAVAEESGSIEVGEVITNKKEPDIGKL